MKTLLHFKKQLQLLLVMLFCNSFYSQTIINEGFNTFPPTGWSVINTNTTSTYNWNAMPNLGAFITSAAPTPQNEWLITPSIDLSSYNTMYLTIKPRLFYHHAISQDFFDFIVLASIDGGVNWTEIWKDDQLTLDLFPQNPSIYSVQTNTFKTINISNYTGAGKTNVKFALKVVSPGSSQEYSSSPVQVYNFIVSGNCPNVDAFSNYGNFGNTDSKIIWQPIDGFSGTYDIEYGPTDFVPGTGTLVTGITGNSFNIPVDLCGANYYIRTNCGGSTGVWSTKKILIKPVITTITSNNTSATITFPDADTTYDIEYGPKNFTTGNGILIENISASTYTINNLFKCMDYDFKVRRKCGANNSPWFGAGRIYINSSNNEATNPSYMQTFDNTLCNIGYYPLSGEVSSGSTNSNMLLLLNNSTSGQAITNAQGINLESGKTYIIKFSAKQYSSNAINLVLSVNNFNKTTFGSVLGTFVPTTTMSEFSTTFSPSTSGTYYFGFRNSSNTVGRGNYVDNFSVTDSLLDIQETTEDNLKIYPNPAKDFLNIDSQSNKIVSFKIYDLSGKQIITQNGKNSSHHQINTQNLQKGIYIVEVKTEKGLHIVKFLKE